MSRWIDAWKWREPEVTTPVALRAAAGAGAVVSYGLAGREHASISLIGSNLSETRALEQLQREAARPEPLLEALALCSGFTVPSGIGNGTRVAVAGERLLLPQRLAVNLSRRGKVELVAAPGVAARKARLQQRRREVLKAVALAQAPPAPPPPPVPAPLPAEPLQTCLVRTLSPHGWDGQIKNIGDTYLCEIEEAGRRARMRRPQIAIVSDSDDEDTKA